ncbi:MAG TPA: glycosyltransferase family 39 protein, partial [Chitinophagales bacterium]|nr:glycosyltransferase family 39 protein [Chitinophagales bacterium]
MDRLVLPPHRPEKLHHVLFAGVLVALFIFKWNDLHLPYFWDELGVYTQAADYQYHHGISLMPASVPAWLSRGHPLFFVALSASVLKLFGENVFAAHLFSLFISSVLLFVVYRKTTKYFDSLTALVAVMLLAIQPLFLAQSALVLPEITLALFVLLALTAYYEKRFALFALF